ncbi:MAG TPA: type II toxin-antitoxin system RelE/ParE family toxin [Candidatus Dormibacteraeota bacterium]|nr:type II toxin-antitoxin system RelE/ParE family toxin [Candidatus Dormibacteraeota bacterium]
MSVRFVLAPQAALDLAEIWRYIKEQTSLTIADRVESAIREKLAFLAETPGAGHSRKDLTDEDVKFFPVYSYLIVYRTQTKPLQVAAILHGRRDVEQILKGRI